MGDNALSATYGTPVPEPSTFTATRVRGGSVSFEYLYLVPHDTANATFRLLFSVTESFCVIIDPNRGVLDTIDMRPVTGITSIDETNDSLVLNGKGYWTNVNSAEYDELIFDVVLVAGGKSYHDARRIRLEAATEEQKSSPLVYVEPYIDEQTDSTVTFALLARRNRGASIDYFPSSERLRVEVLSADGRVLFSSNHGMQYLQEIQPVQPLKREELHRYTFTWGGKDNNGVAVPAGTYTVNLILVTKPEAYKAQTRLDWKGRP
jgi:Intracellular proteinase inhibitor